MIKAGELNRRITIQARTPGVDAQGGKLHTWTDLFGCWAKIAPSGLHPAHAATMAGSEQSERVHDVTIRYRPNLTAAMRVAYAGRFFDVKGVIPDDERHEWTILHCGEGYSDG